MVTGARNRRLLVAQAYSLAGIATFIAIWAYASSRMEHSPATSPWAVAQRMWQLAGSGVVLTNFVDSLWRTVLWLDDRSDHWVSARVH